MAIPCTALQFPSTLTKRAAPTFMAPRLLTAHLDSTAAFLQSPVIRATTGAAASLESTAVKTREPMVPSSFNVLITGSTKGIGYALAKEFLKAGDKVVICSRSAERVESAVQTLREEFGEQHVVQNVMLGKDKMLRI